MLPWIWMKIKKPIVDLRKILLSLAALSLCSCSNLQYAQSPTNVANPLFRMGFKQQSLIVVVPIIQDRNREVGSRTVLDGRVEIQTTTEASSSGKVHYLFPNGYSFALKWKF